MPIGKIQPSGNAVTMQLMQKGLLSGESYSLVAHEKLHANTHSLVAVVPGPGLACNSARIVIDVRTIPMARGGVSTAWVRSPCA